jgi:5-methylcytosine-specific restriction endonuclease McrA
MSRARKNRRAALMEAAADGKDRARCTYCGAAVSRKVGQPGSQPQMIGGELTWPFTQDHIIPKASGGCNDRRNLAPACGPCNGLRGNMPLVEFVAMLGERSVLSMEQARRMQAAAQAVCDATAVLRGR